jgi:hypothetical protein
MNWREVKLGHNIVQSGGHVPMFQKSLWLLSSGLFNHEDEGSRFLQMLVPSVKQKIKWPDSSCVPLRQQGDVQLPS